MIPADIERAARSGRDPFGMADEQPTRRRQRAGEPGPEPGLGRRIEIDDDIATEDDVELPLHRPGRVQVQFLKADKFANGCVQPQAAIGLFQELGPQTRLDRVQHGIVISGASSRHDHLGIDIGRQDANVVFDRIGRQIEQGHGDGIGFLAVGAARRPDANPAPGPKSRDQGWQDLFAKGIEVMVFAEEMRHVRRQRRNHLMSFGNSGGVLHQGKITRVAGQVQHPQPFGQPRLDHAGLAGSDDDARIRIGNRGNLGHFGRTWRMGREGDR